MGPHLNRSDLFIFPLIATLGIGLVPERAVGSSGGPQDVRAPATESIGELRDDYVARPAQEGAPLNYWHDRLYIAFQSLVERTDQRFADNGSPAVPTPAAPFRIGLDTSIVQNSRFRIDPRLDFDVLLELPNIERRLRLFVNNDDVQESPGERGRRNPLRAGLRFPALRALDFDIGLRADFPDAAFMSLRWQRVYESSAWNVQPFAKAYLQTGDGLGFVSGITFDHWRERWLVRSSSYGNWRKNRAATEWTQAFLVANIREIIRFGSYGPIVRGRDLAGGVGVQLLASGERLAAGDVIELSVFAKQATRKSWLYWQVTPLIRWQRENNWRAEPGLYLGAEALFWGLATP